MSAPDLFVRGGYSLGSSIGKNLLGSHNFGTVEEPDNRAVYRCALSVSAETKYEEDATGVFKHIEQPAIRVCLIGEDGNDYKESMWTDAEIATALPTTWDTANVTIKEDYGTGA